MCYVVVSCGAGLLLLQAARNWKQQHDGKGPSTSAERAEFKKQLNAMRRQGPEGFPIDVSCKGGL